MAHTAKLRRVGGSVMVALPPALLETVSLAAGREVVLSVEGGRLVIEPQARPRYTLAQLLAQCDPRARRPAKDREWVDAPPVGRELL